MFEYFANNRSHLLLIGAVVALAALFGLALPALNSQQPGGATAGGAWTPPDPTPTPLALTTAQPPSTTSTAAAAAVVQTRGSASAGTKMAFVVVETATAAPVLLINLPLTPETQWTPEVIDVPNRHDLLGAAAANTERSRFEPLRASQLLTVVVPIPMARGPNGVPGPAPSVAAQALLTPTSEPAPLPLQPTAAVSASSASSGRQLGASPVQATVPTTRPPQLAAATPVSRSAASPTPPPMLRPVAPQLVGPLADARLAGKVTFEWRPEVELAHGMAYEIVVWSPEQDPGQARGIAPPTTMTTQQVNLDPLFDGGQFRLGNLYWTVLIVQRDPYLRLTAPGEGEARYLVRQTGD